MGLVRGFTDLCSDGPLAGSVEGTFDGTGHRNNRIA